MTVHIQYICIFKDMTTPLGSDNFGSFVALLNHIAIRRGYAIPNFFVVCLRSRRSRKLLV